MNDEVVLEPTQPTPTGIQPGETSYVAAIEQFRANRLTPPQAPRRSRWYGRQLEDMGLPPNLRLAAQQLGLSTDVVRKRLKRAHYSITPDLFRPARKYVVKNQ